MTRETYLRFADPTDSQELHALQAIGVDTEAQVIRGFVIAQSGPFKTPGRGLFDDESLNAIVRLMGADPAGTISRYTHPAAGASLGTYLGRIRNVRRDGRFVRGDLHIDASAFISPLGNIGEYVLRLSRSAPSTFGASLTLEADKLPSRSGPPVWRPRAIYSCDVVGDADATHSGFLPQFSSQTDSDEDLDLLIDLAIAGIV